MPKTDEELIGLYLKELRWAHRSPLTIKGRASYLRKFAKEVGIRQASPEKIKEWLSRESLQPQTQTMWLTLLNSFYTLLLREKGKTGIKKNPATKDEIVRPKAKKGQPHPIAKPDLDRALAGAGTQMRCWLLLGALCGCRANEIATLRREDVHDGDAEPWLHIEFGKGNKARDVPLHQDVVEAVREQILVLPTGRMWPLMDGQKMSRSINTYLRKIEAKNIKGERATAHSLRHFFGTETYRNSLDLQLTADLMGHATTAVTSVYAAADRTKAAGFINKIKVGV